MSAAITQSGGDGMTKDRQQSVVDFGTGAKRILSKRQSRRKFLVKAGGVLAAGAFGAVPLRGWAADPINIGALYPTTGSMTQIASEVCERAKVPILTGSSSDQLNKGRTYTFTPFARASQFAQAQLRMSRLVSDKPKVAVIFENTAFGTSTSNGLREQAAAEGVEIVLFEPYSAGFTDASPLINKVKSSGANALFSVSYLNDLILIVRTVKQVGLNIAINGGSGGFVIPDFYKNVGKLAEGLQGVEHWNHDMDANAEK